MFREIVPIYLVQNIFCVVQRCVRIEYETAFASQASNQTKGSVNVVACLRMEGDVRSSCLCKITDDAIDRVNLKRNKDFGFLIPITLT